MDLKPDSKKELKNVGSMLFPCFLAMPKNFRYLSRARSRDLGFGNPKMPDPWLAKKFPWFSFKLCIDRETGNHFQKNFKPKKSKFDPKKHQNCNFYPKMKNGPWQHIFAQFGLPHIFNFLSTRIRHFGEYSGVL